MRSIGPLYYHCGNRTGCEQLLYHHNIHCIDAIMGAGTLPEQEYQQRYLISYGYGDGGGGPTREMLETSSAWKRNTGSIPRLDRIYLKYFEELEERVKDNRETSCMGREFYFEYHRGTMLQWQGINAPTARASFC